MNETAHTGADNGAPANGPAANGPAAEPAAHPKALYFVRRVTAMQDFEVFFVISIATILLVRMILAATGWPQLGGGKIHFAHLLWGGAGMLLAFILFMAMQGRLWTFLATLSAGIGFGLFLDELGKFITSDNDYFFQPAVAIMYVLFVVLFFVFRWLGRVEKMGPQTALVNSFDFAKEAVMRAMSRAERDEALYVLGRADQSDPLVQALTRVLRDEQTSDSGPTAAQRAWGRVRSWWVDLVGKHWFRSTILLVFIFTTLAWLLNPISYLSDDTDITAMDLGGMLAGMATGICTVLGIVRWRASKLLAYRWFERGALIAILIGEFFSFYQYQVWAIFGLVWMLAVLAVIRSMVGIELAAAATRLQQASSGGADGPH
ncbi:MAG: hypothetical protein GX624_01285 [Actinobacteria bacterium]|nr:hypothetical protein [Actinomycetota bacterium]